MTFLLPVPPKNFGQESGSEEQSVWDDSQVAEIRQAESPVAGQQKISTLAESPSNKAADFPAWWPIESSHPSVSADRGLWSSLKSSMDLQQYRPVPAIGIIFKEMNDGSGHHFMLKNPFTHTYSRLSPEEFWVWQQITGEKSIQQLVLAYFIKYKSFAFTAILSLVDRLREANMLAEAPRYLYRQVSMAIQEQSFSNKLTWFARTAMSRELVIKDLDSRLSAIHHYVGWLFFTWLAQFLFFVASILGLFCFLVY